MAQTQKDWKNALRIAIKKQKKVFVDPKEKKRQATSMYRRRRLDSEIRKYMNSTKILRFSDIEEIGNKHGYIIIK